MVTIAQFRKLVLALPEVEEKSHFGQPDFRVANKIFADLGREGGRATLKLTPDSQRNSSRSAPMSSRWRPVSGGGLAGRTSCGLVSAWRPPLDPSRHIARFTTPSSTNSLTFSVKSSDVALTSMSYQRLDLS